MISPPYRCLECGRSMRIRRDNTYVTIYDPQPWLTTVTYSCDDCVKYSTVLLEEDQGGLLAVLQAYGIRVIHMEYAPQHIVALYENRATGYRELTVAQETQLEVFVAELREANGDLMSWLEATPPPAGNQPSD